MPSSASDSGGRRPVSSIVALIVVLAVVVVSQVVVLAYLGSVSGSPNNTTSCAINLWIIKLLCTQSSSPNVNAANAQNLAQLLAPVFAVVDVAFVIMVGLVATSTRARSADGGAERRLSH